LHEKLRRKIVYPRRILKNKAEKKRRNHMKKLVNYFLKGLVILVPPLVVGYVAVRFFQTIDGLLGRYLRNYLSIYVPGLGLIASLAIVIVVGYFGSRWFTAKLFAKLDEWMSKIPLLKSLYSIVKDATSSLTGEKSSFRKVVLVDLGQGRKTIGLLGADAVSFQGCDDLVPVYIPQSFQVAGFTLLIPHGDLQFLDVAPEDAMKFMISAGITGQ
jgi:uncharacterized membrane protein